MEKYGFIYLWYDRKRKMFYLGSHWGNIDDGYICSSNRMRKAYRRRPSDFKRRIIQNNVSRETLLDEEHKWLDKIPDDELGKRYYNLRKHKWGHWSTDENRRLNVGQKISEKNKGRKAWNKNVPMSQKTKDKLSKAISKTMTLEHRKLLSEKCSVWKHTDEAKQKISQRKGWNHSEKTKEKIRSKLKGIPLKPETIEKIKIARAKQIMKPRNKK